MLCPTPPHALVARAAAAVSRGPHFIAPALHTLPSVEYCSAPRSRASACGCNACRSATLHSIRSYLVGEDNLDCSGDSATMFKNPISGASLRQQGSGLLRWAARRGCAAAPAADEWSCQLACRRRAPPPRRPRSRRTTRCRRCPCRCPGAAARGRPAAAAAPPGWAPR
jgi:hypothetical protein